MWYLEHVEDNYETLEELDVEQDIINRVRAMPPLCSFHPFSTETSVILQSHFSHRLFRSVWLVRSFVALYKKAPSS